MSREPDFDIETLLHFRPPRYLCAKCFALFQDTYSLFNQQSRVHICRLCKVKYLPGVTRNIHEYLDSEGLCLDMENPLKHCTELARIAREIHSHKKEYPPIHGLLAAFNAAKKFVHFTSFGISELFIGALKLAAHRIGVRGIVSGIDKPYLISELANFRDEAPEFWVKAYGKDWNNLPHQKLVVIDGLMALKDLRTLPYQGGARQQRIEMWSR